MKVDHNLTTVEKRVRRIRKKVRGTEARPRLTVFRSNKHLYLQVINDEAGKTIVSSSDMDKSMEKELKGKKKPAVVEAITKDIVSKLKNAKVTALVFDRGPYRYHGYVKMIADKLRESGLQF